MKIAYFDLETSDLDGDFGRILCGSVLSFPSGQMKSFRWDNYGDTIANDEKIALDIRNHIESHHISVGYYSKGFDIPFLNTRLAKFDNRHLKRMLHVDPIYYYRGWRGIKPRKSSLRVVSEFLDLEQKPDLDADTWVSARTGNTEALDEVVRRCEADVRITKDVTDYAFESSMVKNIQSYP